MNIGDSITVKVPHRISGLFQIVESGVGRPVDDISKIGSRGGGPSLTAYGNTTIKIVDILNSDQRSLCEVYINGKDCSDSAKTTFYVFSTITSLFKTPVKVKIQHDFEMPIGAGYGASGAGAIGAAFGLNYLLNIGLTYNGAGKIAHIGEVMNKTGLGTVGGQLTGGLSITTKAGYPFELDKVFVPPNTKIICGSFGPIPTGSIIGDPIYKEKIKAAGLWAMTELLANPIFQRYIDIARKFVDKVGLLNHDDMIETKELINTLNKLRVYGASMNQLGKSVYCFCRIEDEKRVMEIFDSYKPKIFVKSLEVSDTTPYLT
jgi:pantoate kinase